MGDLMDELCALIFLSPFIAWAALVLWFGACHLFGVPFCTEYGTPQL